MYCRVVDINLHGVDLGEQVDFSMTIILLCLCESSSPGPVIIWPLVISTYRLFEISTVLDYSSYIRLRC